MPAKDDFTNPPRALARRDFLKLAGASAAAVAVSFAAPGAGRADGPPAIPVVIEELPVGERELAAGTRDGLDWSAASGLQLSPGRAAGTYTSPVLHAARTFTHVSLRWLADLPEALDFAVRVSNDGVTWSQWRSVAREQHAKSNLKETYGGPVSIDRASHVQLRVGFDRARGAAVLRSATLTLLNAKDGVPQAVEAVPEAAPLTQGLMFRREHWGADDTLRFDKGVEIWPRMYVPVKKIAVHHTDTTNDYQTIDDAKAEVRAIYAYQAVTLGWGDIGYNALIDKWGNVYEGRRGRGDGAAREVLSAGVVAGHALEHNQGSLGIALLGTHTRPGEDNEPGLPPTPAQERALIDLLAWECNRHNVDPLAVSDYLLITDKWNRDLHNIPGHRDCFPTICPGGYVYDRLPVIRAGVAAAIKRGTTPAQLTSRPGQKATVATASKIQFDWGPRVTRYRYLLEAWHLQPGSSEDLNYLSGFDEAHYPKWRDTELSSAGLVQLLNDFAKPDGSVPAGHYTFHVMALDDTGRPSYQQDHTFLLTPGDDLAPSVTIASPKDGAVLGRGPVVLSAAASDAEDGDLSYKIAWASSREGSLGIGAILSKTLSAGSHTLTASITDSNGVTRSATVTVTVGG